MQVFLYFVVVGDVEGVAILLVFLCATGIFKTGACISLFVSICSEAFKADKMIYKNMF